MKVSFRGRQKEQGQAYTSDVEASRLDRVFGALEIAEEDARHEPEHVEEVDGDRVCGGDVPRISFLSSREEKTSYSHCFSSQMW